MAQTTPLVALAIKFGGGLSDGILQADAGADNAYGGPLDPLWQQGTCWNAAGRRRRKNGLIGP